MIRPTNEAHSPVHNIVVVEDITEKDDVDVLTDEADVKVQECKEEKAFPDTPVSESDRISVGSDGGSFFDKEGQ